MDATSAAERIDALLSECATDPAAAHRAEELVRALVAFYDTGLRRMLDLVAGHDGGPGILAAVAGDTTVAGMLVVHDLHPVSTAERVSAALERIRPYLGSHAGDVDLLGVDDGVVRLRLTGSCDGCPSSSATVQFAIESAITEAAPEVIRVEVEGVTAPPQPRDAGPGGRTLLPVLAAPVATPMAAPVAAPVAAPTGGARA